jgi:uncharacterized protein (TIGR02646 family)
MIFVSRPRKAPASLRGSASHGMMEFNSNKALFIANRLSELNFTAYRRADVKQALHIVFDEKCAYCETRFGASSDGAVEHYRPKGRFIAEGRPGYWWLAARWDNLLLSCQHCNENRGQIVVTPGMTMEEATRLHRDTLKKPTHGKGNQFPIKGVRRRPKKEDALLIDPTRRDPRKHIYFPPDQGISLAVPRETPTGPDVYGLATINVSALNRFRLVRERTGVLMDLRKHVLELESSIDAAEAAQDQAAKDAANTRATTALAAIAARACKKRPYSAVAQDLYLRLIEWMQAERRDGVRLPIPSLIASDLL